MMITRKTMGRRTVLRGMGTTMALPFLDAMIPNAARAAEEALASHKRLQVIYTPNGMMMQNWTPASTAANFELSLAPFPGRVHLWHAAAQWEGSSCAPSRASFPRSLSGC